MIRDMVFLILLSGLVVIFAAGYTIHSFEPRVFDRVVGTYMFNSRVLELREDHTYILSGKYYEKGIYVHMLTSIELTGSLGFTDILKITDAGLLEKNGNLWVKQK